MISKQLLASFIKTFYLDFASEKGSMEYKSEPSSSLFIRTLCVFFKGLLSLFVAIIYYMAKSKKYTILGGVKVSSEQLSE